MDKSATLFYLEGINYTNNYRDIYLNKFNFRRYKVHLKLKITNFLSFFFLFKKKKNFPRGLRQPRKWKFSHGFTIKELKNNELEEEKEKNLGVRKQWYQLEERKAGEESRGANA